jgi:hypothetical protein
MEEKFLISVPKELSPVGADVKFQRHHFSLLIPDHPVPCSIYIYFKGKYIEIVKREKPVALTLMAKMNAGQNYFFYILDGEGYLFDHWLKKRHTLSSLPLFNLEEGQRKIQQKTAVYLSLTSKYYPFNEESITTRRMVQESITAMREVLLHPSNSWFFNREWDSSLLQHHLRVTYLGLLFLSMYPDLKAELNLFNFVCALLFHELTDTPQLVSQNNKHQQSIAYFTKNGISLNKEIIGLIEDQQELHNGTGIPLGKKVHQQNTKNFIFSLIDRFEHFRLLDPNLTNRKSYEQALHKLQESEDLFEPSLLGKFTVFSEQLKI